MTTTINASWDAVTQRADGSPLVRPIGHYEVQYYIGTSPASGTQRPRSVPATQTSVSIPGVHNGPMGVRVRAVDSIGKAGEWTEYQKGDTSDTPPGTIASFDATFTKNS